MKILLTLIALIFLSKYTIGQKLTSGDYDRGLKLAFDLNTNKLTGYFENFTGWDEKTGNPKFSCVFYIQGTITGNQFTVETYYPNDSDDLIKGNIQLLNNSSLTLKLPEEHGGCWNVQHFADEPVKFNLTKQENWFQIRYVCANKAYFYTDKSTGKKRKAYIIKNNFVCIEKIENDWAFCTYLGKTITKGWIRITDLNKV